MRRSFLAMHARERLYADWGGDWGTSQIVTQCTRWVPPERRRDTLRARIALDGGSLSQGIIKNDEESA